jgi:hypothetical protein
MNIEFNDKDFQNNIKRFIHEVLPSRIEKALAVGAMALHRDCIMVAPTVPFKEGWLRGSGSIHVNGAFYHESQEGKQGFANKDPEGQKGEAIVGFNTPYAARMHEGVDYNFSETGSGAKYLESKLSMFGNQYVKLMAEELKK